LPKKNRLHPLRVRPFRPADEKDCIRMGMRAFSGPGTEDRWRHYLRGNPHLSAGRVLVATRGSARVGMAALLDFRMAVEGRMVPMDGVAAVGVDSLSRQQGVADALLREAIRCSARMRRPLSTLHPFRESFYRKFGYALFEWVQVLTAVRADVQRRTGHRSRHGRDPGVGEGPFVEECCRYLSSTASSPVCIPA